MIVSKIRTCESVDPTAKMAPSGWNAMAVAPSPSGKDPVNTVAGLPPDAGCRSWMDHVPSDEHEATRVWDGWKASPWTSPPVARFALSSYTLFLPLGIETRTDLSREAETMCVGIAASSSVKLVEARTAVTALV